ncbi:MAG: alpha/beta hydrolase [Rhodomicrobium sp.]|nr:alpha/beta hydrolase [Rhodomicrobium sp.]
MSSSQNVTRSRQTSLLADDPGAIPASCAAEERGLTIALPDGRLIGYAEYGDPHGVPIIGMHGTPGSRLMFRIADETARGLGIRLIAPERPGFGLSSFQGRFTLSSFAADIGHFADALGIERFAVAGISGGGPYAAAVAALLPERVTALGLISPVGPMAGAQRTDKNSAPATISPSG